MVICQSGEPGKQCWLLCPNAALSQRQAKVLLALVGLGLAAIAGAFAWAGAWLVLPFAGLELGLLGYGLNASMRQSAVREIITLDLSKVCFEQVTAKAQARCEFPRAWVRVDWSGSEPGKLYLRSHGRRVEIGAFLTEEEKLALAQALRRALAF
jgi:uncharacterized membrane protein